jgi:hypothetical protein
MPGQGVAFVQFGNFTGFNKSEGSQGAANKEANLLGSRYSLLQQALDLALWFLF